jgi:hypothetical protein
MWLFWWKASNPSLRTSRAAMAPEAAEVCAPYQKQATMARTNAGTLAPKVPKDARQHGERHAGFDTGIADKAHECENNK